MYWLFINIFKSRTYFDRKLPSSGVNNNNATENYLYILKKIVFFPLHSFILNSQWPSIYRQLLNENMYIVNVLK